MIAERGGSDELRLATGALRALALVGPVLAAAAAWRGGVEGFVGALVGLGLVGLLFAGGAALTHLVVGRRPSTVATTLVMEVVGRLLAYGAVLVGLDRLGGVHRTTVALTTAIATAVVLTYELRLLSRLPRLFWIDAHTDRPRAVSNTTRSQPL